MAWIIAYGVVAGVLLILSGLCFGLNYYDYNRHSFDKNPSNYIVGLIEEHKRSARFWGIILLLAVVWPVLIVLGTRKLVLFLITTNPDWR